MKQIFYTIYDYIKHTDKLLIALTIAATVFGTIVISGVLNAFASSTRGIYVQIGAAVIGLIAAIVLSKFDYRLLGRLWKLHVPLAYGLVLLTFVLGYGRAGADDINWIALPFGASIQPSEFLKISFILSFAYHLDHVQENVNSPLTLLLLGAHGALPVMLIHFQGDDGTAIVFIFIFVAMLFTAGISMKYIAAAAGAVVAAIPILWNFIMNYDQKMRFLCILFPGIDPQGIEFQQDSSLISIGSGQLSGLGLFSGSHRYISEIQNDFIFAYIGESMGFFGSVLAIGLILAVATKVLFVSRNAKDLLGSNICIGVFTMITVQTIVNVGMCLKVSPVIGITLPFFSKGGSSILSIYLAIGLVLSVYMNNKENMFLDKSY